MEWLAKDRVQIMYKLYKLVEQAEPWADHIIIAVIAVFTYRLYRVHACMQEL